MQHELKSISKAGIPEAIAKAELYRYLNEPEEAESICRDILAVDPGHQLARRMLGLAITDQFIGAASDRYIEVQSIFQGLRDPYEQLYYTGLLHARRANTQLLVGNHPDSHSVIRASLRPKYSTRPGSARTSPICNRSESHSPPRVLPRAPLSISARGHFRRNRATGICHPHPCGTSSREKSSAVLVFSCPSPASAQNNPPCCSPRKAAWPSGPAA